eukprot:UN17649
MALTKSGKIAHESPFQLLISKSLRNPYLWLQNGFGR